MLHISSEKLTIGVTAEGTLKQENKGPADKKTAHGTSHTMPETISELPWTISAPRVRSSSSELKVVGSMRNGFLH